MDISPYQYHRNRTGSKNQILFRFRGINAKLDDMVYRYDQNSPKYDATGKMEPQTSDSRFRQWEVITVYLDNHRMEMDETIETVLEVHRATGYDRNLTNVKNQMISGIFKF